jgi:hypothetical protein
VHSRHLRNIALLAALAGPLCSRAPAQFETRSSFYIESALPISAVVGDFNGDGILDVAEINGLPTCSVEIWLGNSNGTFSLDDTYAVAVFPWYGATASLRKNGILDLVLNDKLSDNVWVMLGNGDGTFQTPVPYSTTAESYMVQLGDFTGGGNLDIITIEGTTVEGVVCNCVEVLPGNGDGTFGAPITTPVPYNIDGAAIAAGDLNNDGKLDVAVSGGFFSTYLVDILLGNGDGTFTPDGYYSVAETPGSIATGYFTSDKKKLDLAVATSLGGIYVLLGNGDGTFEQPVGYAAEFPTWVIARDLDGDGNIDLAASDNGFIDLAGYQPGVTVLNGNGDGTFQAGVFYPSASRVGVDYVASGDFNNDGKPDLLLVDEVGSEVVTLLNTGVATFSPTSPLTFREQLIGSTSAPLTASITNSGTTAMTISSVKASGAPFNMTNSTCAGSLAPGGQCSVTATFTAERQGSVSGTITLRDSASSKPQVVELVGIGTYLKITPTVLSFPPQKVGTTSPPQIIELTNTGNAAMNLTSIILGGLNRADAFAIVNGCGPQLQAGASCSVSVTFTPNVKGTHTEYVKIYDNGGGSPQNVPVTGTGD